MGTDRASAAGVAVVLLLALPSATTTSSPIDNSAWMQVGTELVYEAAGAAFEWKVVVAEANSTALTTRWVFNGGNDVVDAVFDRTTRQLLRSSEVTFDGEVYGFTWITEADRVRGWARLGHENATHSGLFSGRHVFQSPDVQYEFDAVDGRLLDAHRIGTASAVSYSSQGETLVIPTPTIRELLPRMETVANSQTASTPRIPLDCYERATAFGKEPVQCPEQHWQVHGTSSVYAEALEFSLLTVGKMRMTLNESNGESYYDEGCHASTPATPLSPICPAARLIDTTDKPGRHTMWAIIDFDYCLNPIYEFTCHWDVLATAEGDVEEVVES